MTIEERPDPDDSQAFLNRVNEFVTYLHYQHDFGEISYYLRERVSEAMSKLLEISSYLQAEDGK